MPDTSHSIPTAQEIEAIADRAAFLRQTNRERVGAVNELADLARSLVEQLEAARRKVRIAGGDIRHLEEQLEKNQKDYEDHVAAIFEQLEALRDREADLVDAIKDLLGTPMAGGYEQRDATAAVRSKAARLLVVSNPASRPKVSERDQDGAKNAPEGKAAHSGAVESVGRQTASIPTVAAPVSRSETSDPASEPEPAPNLKERVAAVDRYLSSLRAIGDQTVREETIARRVLWALRGSNEEPPHPDGKASSPAERS